MAVALGAGCTSGIPVNSGTPTAPAVSTAVQDGLTGTVSWVDWYGASVPRDSLAGPHTVEGDSARDWENTAPGALMAAAYWAVATDAGMPRAMWEPAVTLAEPAAERDQALEALEVRQTALASRAGFGPLPVAPDVPVQAWGPGIHISGYDRWVPGHGRAQVEIWAREDVTHRWLVRTVTVQRSGAQWVLRLPLPEPWTAVKDPPSTIAPIVPPHPAGETP